MKNNLTKKDLVNKLRLLYIQRYEALYKEDNHIKGNRLERQFTKIEEELIVSEEGVLALKTLLDDESEIVRYYVASTLISLFPKKCKEVLRKIQKGNTYLASDVKYILINYEEGNNYFQKFLSNNK
ncbi:MAG: hypothetical protein IJ415_00260 [Clostridia bacterium]|nr:hypothetical protein [Clostridia bacterium]